jgi:uncharacterized protein YjbI with pentapeptide repeats
VFYVEVNAQMTGYECTLMHSHHAVSNPRNMKIANMSFVNLTNIKHFGITLTKQNCIGEDITDFNLGNILLYLHILSHRLLSKNANVIICKLLF